MKKNRFISIISIILISLCVIVSLSCEADSDSDVQSSENDNSDSNTGNDGVENDPPLSSDEFLVRYETSHGTAPKSIAVKKNITLTEFQLPSITATGYMFNGWFDGNTEVVQGKYIVSKSITLKAKWSPITYSVIFDGNAEDCGKGGRQAFTYDSVQSLAENTFTRSGYTFSGWNTERDGSGVSYADKESVKNLMAENGGSITLYAQWSEENSVEPEPSVSSDEFLVRYETSHGTAPISIIVKKNIALTELQLPSISATGYIFNGWFDGNTEAVQGNYVVTKSIILKAKWTPFTYTVIFEGNCTDCEDVYRQSFTYDSVQSLAENSFTRSGYAFIGWNTERDGSGVSYCDKEPVKNLTGENDGMITLYAQWAAQNSVDTDPPLSSDEILVRYETSHGVVPEPIVVRKMTTFLEEQLPSITATGYIFSGWFDGDIEAVRGNYFTSESVTLKAKWTPITYTVTFSYNGNVFRQPFTYDVAQCLAENSFTRSGYTFAGWNTERDGSGVAYADKESVKNLVGENFGSITLYAQWVETAYRITYRLDGGEYANSDKTVYTVNSLVSFGTPVRKGYIFMGWYTNEDFSYRISNTADKTEHLTLYAKWTPITYWVYFNLVDRGSGTMQSQEFTYDEEQPILENEFSSPEGWIFAGWSDSWDGARNGDIVYEDKESVKNLSAIEHSTVRLYAVWKPLQYSVTYNLNDSEDYPAEYENLNQTVFTATEIITFGRPSRPGYYFKGWFTDEQLSEESSVINTDLYHESFSVYAKWEPCLYEIFYNLRDTEKNPAINSAVNINTFTAEDKIILGEPTRPDYDFIGWYTDYEYSESSKIESTQGQKKSLKVYAKWSPKKYPIIYNLNDTEICPASNASDNPSTYTIEGSYFLNSPSRAGCKFLGWYTDAQFPESSRITKTHDFHGTLTVYAKWQEFEHNITYHNIPPQHIDAANYLDSFSYDATQPFGSGDLPVVFKETSVVSLPSGVEHLHEVKENFYCRFFYDADCTVETTGWSAVSKTDDVDIYIKYYCTTETAPAAIAALEDINLYAIYVTGEIPESTNGTSDGVISKIREAIHDLRARAGHWNDDLSYAHIYLDLSGTYGLVELKERAFESLRNLRAVVLPDGVKTIGDYAFTASCWLNSINIPSSVTQIGEHIFFGCYSISLREIPSSVTSIGKYAFNDVPFINPIINISAVTIGEHAFDNCKTISELNLSSSVTSIGVCAFKNCTGLTKVNLPSGITSIGGFSGCTGLTEINIPSSVTSIDASAFSGCTGLTEIELPSGVTSIGDAAFSGCTGLSKIELPSGITNIASRIFKDCTGLEINIPSGITSIGASAFYNCKKIKYYDLGTGWYYTKNSNDWINKQNGILYSYGSYGHLETSTLTNDGYKDFYWYRLDD